MATTYPSSDISLELDTSDKSFKLDTFNTAYTDIQNHINGIRNKIGTIDNKTSKLSSDGTTYSGTATKATQASITTTAGDIAYYSDTEGTFASDTKINTANALINSLTTEDSDPVDDDYYISQYANGGTDTTTYHRRKHSSLFNYIDSKIDYEFILTISTSAYTQAKVATTTSNYRLLANKHFGIYLATGNSAANATLNINSTGAKEIKLNNASTDITTSNLTAGLYDVFYNGTYYIFTPINLPLSNYVTVSSQASTPIKIGSCSSYFTLSGLSDNRYFFLDIYFANTSKTILTLNINSTGAKPIYINNIPTSTTVYTLPKGLWLCHYHQGAYFVSTHINFAAASHTHTVFDILNSIKTTKPLYNSSNYWQSKTWSGAAYNLSGIGVWTDGTDIYYSDSNNHYVLDKKDISYWSLKTWKGLTNFGGNYIWTDGMNIYYSNGTNQYVLDKPNSTWSTKTWSGLSGLGRLYGNYIWTDGMNIYYSNGSTNQYVLDKDTSTWSRKTWSGLTDFSGEYIWTDGTDTYFSYGSNHYVLNKSNSTWSSKTWNGLTNFSGNNIWTDGMDIYYSYLSAQYVLNKSASTWYTKTWNGLSSFSGEYIWTDGTDIYYSIYTTSSSVQYVLNRKPLHISAKPKVLLSL